MSDEDYNAAYMASLQGAGQPTKQDQQPAPTPVHGFWHRLLHGAEGPHQNRAADILKGMGRGLAGAANNVGRSALEFGLFLDRKTGFGELTNPGFNKTYDEMGGSRGFIDNQNPDAAKLTSSEDMLAAYGNRSDDPLANFAESSTQFFAGVALARGVGVTSMYGQAAIADATVFDPYEAQLAELAAKAPSWTGLDKLGDLLSVKGDDSALVARLKRSAAGAISGAVLDGLFAGVRWLRGSRTLASSTATAAEKTAAAETVKQAEETLQKVSDAAHTAEGDHVVVRPTEDGHYTLQADPKSPVVLGVGKNEAARITEFDAIANEARDLSVKANRTPEETARLHELTAQKANYADLLPPAHNGGGKQVTLTAAQMEAADAKQLAKLDARRQALKDPKLAQEFVNSEGVKFKNRGEAEAQAAVMNDGLNARLRAAEGLTSAELNQHRQFAKDLLGSQTPEEIATRAENANFNLSYYASQPEVMSQIEAISKQFKSAMDEVQGRPGGVPVEQSIKIAREAIGGMTEREAPAVVRAKLKTTADLHAWLLASDMVMRDMGKKLVHMSELLDVRPHDVVAHEEARIALENFYGVTRELAGANSEVGRSLRILQERSVASEAKVGYKAEGTPPTAGTAPAPKSSGKVQGPKQMTAGMSHRDIRAQLRMIKMAGGAPRDVFAVAHGAEVIKQTGVLSKAFEVFANFLLSGPRTVQTVFASGAGVNMFEPVVRMAAGAGTFNRALFQEGADIMWGNFKYLGDNLKAMAASLRAGRSIINPQPQHIAIGGVTGSMIRVPGRVLTAADEFSRLTAYRAYVRAKSLRLGREQGLAGAALESRAAEDLRSAFDAETGIATLPEALKYAEVPTMSGPLGKDTFGGGLQSFVNNHLEARFIAPFVKASVNIFRYVHKSIPVLNMLNAETRAAIMRGGEEAAVIHARSALASTVYGFALYQAMAGNCTGRGPSDPDLRKLWMKNNQPYSCKVGSTWISYKQLDPLATPLGLIADLNTVIHELGDKQVDGTDLATATVTALFYNLSSKTYMSGITQFAEAWASNDPRAAGRWMQNFAGNAAVPNAVAATNPDSVYRDVQSMADAIIARIPGWSKTLDPKFDMFGEPVLKTPGVMNRNQIFTTKAAGHSVEDDLLAVGKGLAPLNPKMEGGLIDLKDRAAYDNGTHKSPYIRMMELIRNPVSGEPSLRQAMTELTQSPKWNESSDGTSLFPGGKRWILAAALKDKYEGRALKQVMEEYPRLREQIRAVRRMKGAAITSGEQGVQSVEQMFGVTAK